ncbi:MAG: NAD-dependent epimerase/dehydratase family protein [bacterium]|nr:NAD-dependent epimerase/dehydratase family protein [bacterium]
MAPGGHTCRRPPEASTLYHTGDLARWLPDGNIEFLGRMDHQVKIRGYRIELGEIESSLSAHPEIREAAVLARETKDGDMFICAYYSGGDTTSASGFRDFLSRGLPGYMIPAHFVWVERIPLNANGKVDAKKLNSTPINGPSALNGTAYAEPVSENEKAVAAVWREVLNRDKISLHDDFFEIGGDSIKAIRVLSKLQVTFEITLNDIFEYQTLLHLAGKILYKGDTNRVKLKIEELKQRILAEPDINESRRDELTKRREKAFTRYRKQYTADVTRDISPLIPYENILLTGGTGYLGIHLLQALLQNTTARIHVLVRGQNAEEAGERLQRKFHWYFKDTPYQKYKARISVIAGDIAADSFKLPAKQYAKLSQSIDCIINSAAFVKHYGKYDDFHQINVQGVKRLLEFAGSGKGKDFNQISTTGVAGTVKKVNGFVFFSEYETGTDAQKEPNYYIRTKLEAENLVLEAHKKGITANIIRVGNLIFQSRTGIFQENIEDNAFYSQMKSLIKIGLFPEMHAQSLEFSFVDYTAEAVSLLFAAKELKNETYHVRNPHHISYTQMADFIRQARSQRETPLKTVPGDEFLDFIKDNYDHNVYSHYIKPFLLHSHILEEQEDSIITFSSEKTEKLLEKLGFHWPEPNGKHVEKMLQHGKERNFF